MSFRLVCDRPPIMTAVTHPEPQRLFIMQRFTLPIKAMKPALFSLSAALSAAALALTAHAETRVSLDLRLGLPAPIIVEQAPPRPVVERMVVSPGPGYVWIAGHYSWRHGRWEWFPGVWALPPQPGAFYVEGRWDERSRNWIEAHWEMAPPPPPPVEYVVEGPPPPPRQEIIVAQPGPGYIWIGGYWAWHHHHHEWVGGHWEMPPHGHHVWVEPRWEHRCGSYVFIEGSWR